MKRVTLLSVAATLLGAVACIACSGGTRSVFRPSDPAFTPRVGETPVVYLHRNIQDVPRQSMRSVGLIEVTVPNGAGIDRAVEAAAKKGRELGCWILIEHSAFASVESRASFDHGATVILVHGPGLHIGRQRSPTRERIAQFDCVVQRNSSARAGSAAPRSVHLETTIRLTENANVLVELLLSEGDGVCMAYHSADASVSP